jgi:hypothetical protein
VVTYALEKYLAIEAFTEQATVMIGEGDDHGPHLVTLNHGPEILETQHAGRDFVFTQMDHPTQC